MLILSYTILGDKFTMKYNIWQIWQYKLHCIEKSFYTQILNLPLTHALAGLILAHLFRLQTICVRYNIYF